eukprot:scaffold17950_cov68-Phaeocystis_antarctica.AAC.3
MDNACCCKATAAVAASVSSMLARRQARVASVMQSAALSIGRTAAVQVSFGTLPSASISFVRPSPIPSPVERAKISGRQVAGQVHV